MYGGRMRLVNRCRSPSWPVRRSFTRGALTGIVPAPIVTFRVRPLAVANDQGVTVAVTFVAVRLQVRGDLGLQRRHQHPTRPLAGDLVQQGSPVHLVLRRLVADDLQHGCRLLPPAHPAAAVDQAGEYAAGVTGSTIHNFRSYLKAAAKPARPGYRDPRMTTSIVRVLTLVGRIENARRNDRAGNRDSGLTACRYGRMAGQSKSEGRPVALRGGDGDRPAMRTRDLPDDE